MTSVTSKLLREKEEEMLTIYQLEVTVEATTPLALDVYCGSALRGAFFHALWGRFCANREATSCYECPLNAACPVSTLVAPLRNESRRGRDLPRPYIITPRYTGKDRYAPGESYTFGFTLIGDALKLYPYVIRAFLEMEHCPLGHPLKELRGKRGSFRLCRIDAVHPFAPNRVCLWQQGKTSPEKPQLGITINDVAARAKQLPQDSVCVHFLSPTRLVAGAQVLRQPDFMALALRLAERLEQVQQAYGRGGDGQQREYGREWYLSVKKQAEGITIERDETRWVDVRGYSTRQQQQISLSGFLGRTFFIGPVGDLLHELLTWGELLRVGKHIVKGAGLYRIGA